MGPADTRWVICHFHAFGSADVEARCRRKGDPLDWDIERKPQMIVKFNHLDKQGRFRGLRRLNLEAFDGAEAPIRDRVGMWLMREAGIDAPRVNHARVFKDGAYLGLYQNIESEDKEFLEDHFGQADSQGNLWEGGLELKTNESMPAPSQLTTVKSLVAAEPLDGDHSAFYGKITTLIDVDQILQEMAGETVLLADDNFSNGSTNFNFYEHPRRGLVVLPWDFDSIITDAPADADLYNYLGVSSEANRLRLLMNQNPTWRKRYDDLLVNLRDQHLSRVPAKVDQVCAQIAPAVMTDPSRTSGQAEFQADCAKVKAAALARVAAIKAALGR
jgi:spore coat protein CotH